MVTLATLQFFKMVVRVTASNKVFLTLQYLLVEQMKPSVPETTALSGSKFSTNELNLDKFSSYEGE